jgi:hypothetical protein
VSPTSWAGLLVVQNPRLAALTWGYHSVRPLRGLVEWLPSWARFFLVATARLTAFTWGYHSLRSLRDIVGWIRRILDLPQVRTVVFGRSPVLAN